MEILLTSSEPGNTNQFMLRNALIFIIVLENMLIMSLLCSERQGRWQCHATAILLEGFCLLSSWCFLQIINRKRESRNSFMALISHLLLLNSSVINHQWTWHFVSYRYSRFKLTEHEQNYNVALVSNYDSWNHCFTLALEFNIRITIL